MMTMINPKTTPQIIPKNGGSVIYENSNNLACIDMFTNDKMLITTPTQHNTIAEMSTNAMTRKFLRTMTSHFMNWIDGSI